MHILLRSFRTYPLRYLLVCMFGIYVLTLFPYNFLQRNNVVCADGVVLSHPATAYTTNAHQDLSSLYRFTMLLHLVPETGDVNHVARIFSSAQNFSTQNFAIAQVHSALNIQLFSRDSPQFNEVTIPDVFKTHVPLWMVITFNGDILRCYINGVKRAERVTGPMALTQWDSTAPLVIGCDPNGSMQWEGCLHTIAILDRWCSPIEVQTPVLILNKYSSIIHYQFDRGSALSFRSTGTDRDSLFVPALFRPYDRLTLFDTFLFLGRQGLYVRDLVANVFFFLPVGYFSAMFLWLRRMKIVRIITLSVIAGLLLSVSVELLQIFLPSRYSSMVDVLSNTAGTAIGAMAGLIHSIKGMYDDKQRNVEDRS